MWYLGAFFELFGAFKTTLILLSNTSEIEISSWTSSFRKTFLSERKERNLHISERDGTREL